MSIEVKVDTPTKDINRKLKDVKNGTPIVIVRSLNYAGSKANTVAKERIREVYSIKHSPTRYMKVKKGNYGDMTYIITGRSSNLNAFDFKVNKNTVKRVSNKNRRAGNIKNRKHGRVIGGSGAKLQVLKSGGQKELTGDSRHSKAFIATMRNGHKGVFQRVGNGENQPIKEVRSVGIASMMKNDEVYSAVYKEQMKSYETRMDHEINRLLDK